MTDFASKANGITKLGARIAELQRRRFAAAQKAYLSRVQTAISEVVTALAASSPADAMRSSVTYAADWIERWVLFCDTLRNGETISWSTSAPASRPCWCSNTKQLSMAASAIVPLITRWCELLRRPDALSMKPNGHSSLSIHARGTDLESAGSNKIPKWVSR